MHLNPQEQFLKCIEAKASVRAFFKVTFFLLFIGLFYNTYGDLFRFQANAPISGFLSPFFNEFGDKTWQCTGEQVKYISDSKIKIKKMCISFFCPQHLDQVDMVVRSDNAVISIPEQRASGKTLLTVTSPSYTIVGENWFWEGKRSGKAYSKIFIGKNASVMFYE